MHAPRGIRVRHIKDSQAHLNLELDACNMEPYNSETQSYLESVEAEYQEELIKEQERRHDTAREMEASR